MQDTQKALTILLALFFAASCALSGINSVSINRESGQASWRINNVILQSSIEIKDIKFKGDGEILRLYVLLSNKKNSTIGTEIKVEFYDKDGFPYDNPWGWQPIMLEPKQDEWIKFVAPKKEDQIIKIKVMLQKVTENK
jgi:uncharacterized protein YcfL